MRVHRMVPSCFVLKKSMLPLVTDHSILPRYITKFMEQFISSMNNSLRLLIRQLFSVDTKGHS